MKEHIKTVTFNRGGDAVYFFGIIGAAFGTSLTERPFPLWMGVLGLLKAFVWPAFVVHSLMGFLNL